MGTATIFISWNLVKKLGRRGWESNPQDSLRRQSLANSCNNHYATSPIIHIYLLAEEVGLEPTNPLRGYSFQDYCNGHYATPPDYFYHKCELKSIMIPLATVCNTGIIN